MIKLFEKIRTTSPENLVTPRWKNAAMLLWDAVVVELVEHGQQIIYQKLVLIVNI